MRKFTILVFILTGLAALFMGVANSWATHGNATYDCKDNAIVLKVTILGDTVWSGYDTAFYVLSDGTKTDPVHRDETGKMPNIVVTIPDGGVILGWYDGPNAHARNHPVPYTVTGDIPACVEQQTTTTVTGETTTTVTNQTTTTSGTNETTTTSTNWCCLPATGSSDIWKKVACVAILLAVVGGLILLVLWTNKLNKETKAK